MSNPDPVEHYVSEVLLVITYLSAAIIMNKKIYSIRKFP